MGNYAVGRTLPDVENGHRFVGDNFIRLEPHTPIFVGKTGLIFVNCNLTNCDPPAGSTYEGCQPKHCEFCSNLHPDWVASFGLSSCDVNCDHVTSTDTITIDGVVVDTVYHYEDTRVE